MSLLGYTKKQFLKLDPEEICWQLSKEEILHLFSAFDAYWSYDFRAADEGRVGCHAILSDGFHSNGFFNSRPVLEHDNLCRLFCQAAGDEVPQSARHSCQSGTRHSAWGDQAGY